MDEYPVFDEFDQSVIAVEGFAHDLTQFKQMEQELHHSQKMSALGTLAGGIAHNFDNLLAGIKGNIYLANRKNISGEAIDIYLGKLDDICDRAADLIKQLMTFSHKLPLEYKPFNFNELVNESISTARLGILGDRHITSSICEEQLHSFGDVSLLQQIIINLMKNASDAVENQEKKDIFISLETVDCNTCSSADQCHLNPNRKTAIKLTIEDSGCGIPETQMTKIFEPFFTTKGVNGTGLGLSTSFNTIQSHGGNIIVKSTVGEGTKFVICMPLLKEQEVIEQQSKESSISISGIQKTILIMDDNKDICKFLEQVLLDLECRVIVAYNGQQGADYFNQSGGEIDLIISDITMPVMDGPSAVRHIRKSKPDIPVIFITGHNEEDALDGFHDDNIRVIPKPFSIPDLNHLIMELLT